MPESIDPRGQDNPSQYFVEDRSSNAEMIRQMIQDSTVTAGMGGPLSEQPDPVSQLRVLDIGCGPGGWILETAARYPHMSLVGIDISWRMIEYARAQAQAQKLSDRTEFLVMDALRPLEFPDDSFDLVNMRFGFSFLLVKDWPRLLRELLRVTRPGGVVRVTDGTIGQSTSPAFNRINQMFLCALYLSGHHLNEQDAMTHELPRLLSESGCQQVQTKDHTLELVAGTVGGQNFYQDMMFAIQTGKPFIQKWGCAAEDYDALYEQALIEMQQPDFRVTWPLVTAWGIKPSDTPAVCMSDSNLLAVSPTQKKRTCYLATPTNIDLRTIEELLEERQIRLILSADLPSMATTFLEGLVNAISNADLFIAVLSPEQSNDQIYIELGIAIAKERRILILAPPGVSPTLDIAEIPTIRADATNQDAISFMLDQVLEAPPRRYRPPLPTPAPQKSQSIGDFADELLEQLDAHDKHMTEAQIIYLLILALERSAPSSVVREPFLEDRNNLDSKRLLRPDLMVWSDEFGPWLGNPLIIEVKRTLRGEKDCTEAVRQVLSYLQFSQTRSALIVYANKTSSIENLSAISPPNVFSLDIHELLNAMRTKSFARVMIDLRNRRMHGIDEI